MLLVILIDCLFIYSHTIHDSHSLTVNPLCADLGPPRVRYRGVEYKRKDFSVQNSRGLAVVGSVWELINPRLGDSESCILYLHPNSGSRVDVVKTRCDYSLHVLVTEHTLCHWHHGEELSFCTSRHLLSFLYLSSFSGLCR